MSDKPIQNRFRSNEMMLGGFAAVWLAIGVSILGQMVFPHEDEIATTGYPVEVPEEMTQSADAEAVEEVVEPIETFILAASVADGEKVFRKCQSCHTYEAGGRNGTGPNLYNVVGADIGAHAGFDYSDALLGLDGNWTYEKLSAYLEKPRDFAPGNRMAFAGLSKPEERGAVIRLLMENTENPPPVEVPEQVSATDVDDAIEAVDEAVEDIPGAEAPE